MSKKFKNPWGDDGQDLEDILRKGQEKIVNLFKNNGDNSGFGGKGGNNSGPNFPANKTVIAAAFSALFFLWLFSGIYIVQPDEEGVVMRFGRYNRTSSPGLNYKMPAPVESVTKISVTRINKEEVGFRSSGKRLTSRQDLLQNTVSTESQMLTTDENIVDINSEIQWLVSDAKDFLFNVRDLSGENTVKSVAESALREVIGLKKVTDVLAEERSKIEQDAKLVMQNMLDNYKMGVRVVRVQLLRVEPPQEVIDAYRDVQNAKQDKERKINEAISYRNDIVPRARGEYEKILLDSEGYKQRVIAEADGESKRFESILMQYKNAKDVTRKRMYIETMEEVLSNVEKIILDKSSASNVVPYLSMNEIGKKAQDDTKK